MADPSICWLPADPVTGGPSMLRWWRCLAAEARKAGSFSTHSFLGDPPHAEARMPGRVGRAWRKYVRAPLKLRMHPKAGLYHLLDHSWAHLLDSVPRGVPRVATVHDLIPLRFPDGMSAAQLERWRRVVGRIGECDCIVADSAYTKAETTALLGIPGERIVVVPLGVDLNPPAFSAPGRVTEEIKRLRLKGADLVIGCLGSGLGRKNLEIVPKALERLDQEGIRVAVARAGPGLTGSLAGQFDKLKEAGRFADLGFISDQEVDEFYREVDVQVMPSLYEGFGLPVLEAMAAGTAVICSNTTSLPEVAGEAALMFDPTSPESLAGALKLMLDTGVRGVWRQRGLERAQGFSWTETWKRYETIYRDLLS